MISSEYTKTINLTLEMKRLSDRQENPRTCRNEESFQWSAQFSSANTICLEVLGTSLHSRRIKRTSAEKAVVGGQDTKLNVTTECDNRDYLSESRYLLD